MVKAKQFSIFFKKLLKTDIVKVFSLTAIATLVKVLTSFISIKVVAVVIGPAGIALLGQLTNFSSIVMSVATGGINNGVTKYVAEHREERNLVSIYISTGFRIIVSISIVCGILLILLSEYLGEEILLSKEYSYVFRFFGFTVVLYALNNYLVSILNGYKEFKKYSIIGIVTSVIGLIFTVTLVFFYEVKGALVSAVTYQSIVFFVSLVLVLRSSWFTKENFILGFSSAVAKKYSQYSIMALTSALTVPVALLLIRGHIINVLNTEQAGLWEAMNKISGVYIMVITTSLGVYYLPKLSELKEIGLVKREVISVYKFIIPITLVLLTFIFISKTLIIKVLFSEEFYSMDKLFLWQLIGDFFKICSWVIGFALISKSMTKLFVFTEVLFSISYILLAFLFIKFNGTEGAVQAYMVNYALSLLFLLLMLKNKFNT